MPMSMTTKSPEAARPSRSAARSRRTHTERATPLASRRGSLHAMQIRFALRELLGDARAADSAFAVHLGHALVARDTLARALRARLVLRDEVRIVDECARHRGELEPLVHGGLELVPR